MKTEQENLREKLLIHQKPLAMQIEALIQLLKYQKLMFDKVSFESYVKVIKESLIKTLDELISEEQQ